MRHFLLVLVSVQLMWAATVVAEVHIEDGYVRAMPPGLPTTAAFMRLVNTGDKDVVIDGGNTPAAARVEFHAHVNNGGMMSMQRLAGITVPAGGEFILEPGDHHMMLIDLSAPLREGDSVTLQLYHGKDKIVEAELPVRSVLSEHQH